MRMFLNTMYIVAGILLLFLTPVMAQETCSRCKMDIRDDHFRAEALDTQGNTYQFDAIECLVNFLKSKNEADFSRLSVADYNNGQLLEADAAQYLKSKGLPSPMGAYLSAYGSLEEGLKMQEEKGGEVYNWEELKQRFSASDFGATGHGHHHHGANAYAPSGLAGDHLHPKGGLMVSVRYMFMFMEGNRQGSDRIPDEVIFDSYMVAPQQMDMQMGMLGVMYAPSDRMTLMFMQNFVRNDMDLTARMMMNGMTMLNNFNTSSSGLGDMKLGLLYGLHSGENLSFHLNSRFNIPIGEIQARDDTPMMADAKLPYAMQLGTGTFDITIGATLKGHFNEFAWGIQQLNTFRTGTNSEGYRFGNFYELNSWLGYNISNQFALSARISGSSEGRIKGSDPELNPMMVVTADPDNYGGERIHAALGFNVLLLNDKLILGAEAGTPLYQNFNGIFMNTRYTANGCIKYTVL